MQNVMHGLFWGIRLEFETEIAQVWIGSCIFQEHILLQRCETLNQPEIINQQKQQDSSKFIKVSHHVGLITQKDVAELTTATNPLFTNYGSHGYLVASLTNFNYGS